jgi:hypothetical protein
VAENDRALRRRSTQPDLRRSPDRDQPSGRLAAAAFRQRCCEPRAGSCLKPRPRRPSASLRDTTPTWFDPFLGRPKERSKPDTDARRPKFLICPAVLAWVPNGPSEQPRRKPGVREGFRASGASPRCTAIHKKRPNSWAFHGRSADGETVRIGSVGGREGFELSVPDGL